MLRRLALTINGIVLVMASMASAQDTTGINADFLRRRPYSPYADRAFLTDVYFGASELGTVWIDPDFDPSLRAFYYARVIEIPTPRWTAYDRVKFNLDLPPEIPLKTQERAYTSPIWYTPNG